MQDQGRPSASREDQPVRHVRATPVPLTQRELVIASLLRCPTPAAGPRRGR
jgi:hypothetical protein